jgi:hypothetical protein
MVKAATFRTIHVGALALCLVLMPWSTALLSMAQILLVLNWIIGGLVLGEARFQWKLALRSTPVLLFLGFLAVHVIGLLWTSPEGMEWGLSLVRILLPVLVFGVVLGGSQPLSQEHFRMILLAGAWSVLASTLAGVALRGWDADYRQLSAFISHIRLALMLCMSIAVLLYFWDGAPWRRLLHLLAVVWAVVFINLLGSIQGLFILLVLALVAVWRWTFKHSKGLRWGLRGLAVLPLLLALHWSARIVGERYLPASEPVQATHTAGGEAYVHMPEVLQQENGNRVWSHIAWSELHRTWHARSERRLDSLDGRGHLMYPTLLRYLASKGLTKDSVGIMALTAEDIQRVESGVPNHLWGSRARWRDRVEEVLFEMDQYLGAGSASGHSVAMRLEFWKAGWQLLRENWILGVGTGDTQVAFDRQYERMNSSLAPEWRYRAHNQYLTWAISFGAPGALLLLFLLWWPARVRKAWRQLLFVCWLVIIGIGSFTDDTVETQAGATFFALYYALFVLASPRIDAGAATAVVATTGAGRHLQHS